MADLHRWTDPTDREWACGVYDHGPFCRLCQQVDGTLAALFNNVDEGLMEWKVGPDGGFSFKLTPKGMAQVDQITAVPVVAEMMDQAFPEWRDARDGRRCKLHNLRGCGPCASVFGDER